MLMKASTSYHTYDNLDMTAQHLEDSIRNAFEANCSRTKTLHDQNPIVEQKAAKV